LFALTTNLIKPKLSLKDHWIVLYKVGIIYVDQKSTKTCCGGHLGFLIGEINVSFVEGH
jgi:hypothetical protein